MDTILLNTQNRLAEIEGTPKPFIDEDTGQLDYYAPNFPVKWPAILIDITGADFTDIGKDRRQVPQNRQMGEIAMTITIANLKLGNTSHLAPANQKVAAWSIHTLINEVHKKLHGFCPEGMAGPLMRKRFGRVKRDDGVQEYKMIYTGSITDV